MCCLLIVSKIVIIVFTDFLPTEYGTGFFFFSDHLNRIECIVSYLNSFRYIDELQKFVEDDLYRLSLALEPDCSSVRGLRNSMRRQATTPGTASLKFDSNAAAPLRDLYAKTQSLTPQMSQFKPSHRKTQSLGSNAAFK